MSLSIEQLRALLRAIEEYPELREELRRHVLTHELLALPIEMQRRDQQLDRIEQDLRELRNTTLRHEELLARLVTLAERHEERLARLEELAQRHDERLAELTEITARLAATSERHEQELAALRALAERHDERIAELTEITTRLAATSERHEQRLEELTITAERHERTLRQIRSELASVTVTISAMVEADAADALVATLERKGYTIKQNPWSVAVNGELDLAALVVDPQGQEHWVVVEVKVQLHRRDIRNWARKLTTKSFLSRLAREAVEPPFLAYVYGQRIYRDALQTAASLGLGVLSRRGELVEPAGLVLPGPGQDIR